MNEATSRYASMLAESAWSTISGAIKSHKKGDVKVTMAETEVSLGLLYELLCVICAVRVSDVEDSKSICKAIDIICERRGILPFKIDSNAQPEIYMMGVAVAIEQIREGWLGPVKLLKP